MNAWWDSLPLLQRMFWGIAIFASVLQILMFFGAMFGHGHDFDHDAAVDGASGVAGAQILSLRTLVAGAVGFGWAGVLASSAGASDGVAITLALICGVAFMLMVFGVMQLLFSMRADGTLDYRNAVGLTGKVYVTVPAQRRGAGQVEIMLQGRLTMAAAQTDAPAPLSPQTPIRVSAAQADNTLIVEPVTTSLA
jgi:hypothetical protein